MSTVWARIEAELDEREVVHKIKWVADQLGCGIQRVQNWTTRGVPTSAYPDIAKALGKSLDWVAGVEGEELRLTEEERALVLAFRDRKNYMAKAGAGKLDQPDAYADQAAHVDALITPADARPSKPIRAHPGAPAKRHR